MLFDDRLATVLRQRATGEAGLRTQMRQLLDLLGRARAGAQGDQSLLAAAWLRLEALAEAIPASERARMIREPGWRLGNPDLVAHLAEQESEVAAAALSRASLSAEEWTALIPDLPVRARGFLRLRRDLPVDVEALLARLGVHDRGLPAPDPAPEASPQAAPPSPALAAPGARPDPPPLRVVSPAASPSPPPAPTAASGTEARTRSREESGRSEISALVERIAQYQRTRGESRAELEIAPRLPLGEAPERSRRALRSFGFAADTTGRIEWASGEAAPMVIGTRLFQPPRLGEGATPEAGLARAFARRQPIVQAPLTLVGAPAIAGDWLVDATPQFSEEGHFSGYFGRLRRDPGPASAPPRPEVREADRIRQLLHELRTPVTAVQGYAEVIQQQLFGPAPHEYRALAAAIAADAARILAGFEELDRLARLETGALALAPGEADLAALVRATATQLDPVIAGRAAALVPAFAPETALLVGIDHDDAEAMVWRLLASLAAAAGAGERLSLSLAPLIGPGTAMARLACTLPAALAGEENLFAATARSGESAVSPGLFGTGFALRLARAEARAAGGALQREGELLVLRLPLYTESGLVPSPQAQGAEGSGG